MARIVYSMAGEGRGHATRARAVVEELRRDHQLVLFAPGDAYDMLSRTWPRSEVRVHRIPGLRFQYSDHGINYRKTLSAAFRYLCGMGRVIRFLEEMLRRVRPELAITDFEPTLPRAARRCGIPVVSFDHQHFLRAYDLSSLPLGLRLRAWGLARIVGGFCVNQIETIVSSFYFPPLKKSCRNVTQVGVMLRPEVLKARPMRGGHLLVYLRREVPPNVLTALKQLGRPVKVYGVGQKPCDGNLEFLPIAEKPFIDDLAGCEAVVSTAGNQLVGEALYLLKPVLALPEKNNHEQRINAHFLVQGGGGMASAIEGMNVTLLDEFLQRGEEFRSRIEPQRVHGNPAALAAIRRHLPQRQVAVTPQEVIVP